MQRKLKQASSKKKHICVIGGTGFIGRNLLREFSRLQKSIQVTATGVRNFTDLKGMGDSLSYVQGDCRAPATKEVFKHSDVVVMLAGLSTPASSKSSVYSETENHILPALDLFNCDCDIESKRVVFISSGGAIYRPGKTPFREDSPTGSASSYGAAKLALENLLQTHCSQRDWEYVGLRPGNPIGPHQVLRGGQGLLPVVLQKAFTGETLTVYGGETSKRDYFDVRDLAAAIRIAALHPAAEGTYNVGSGQGKSVLDVVRIVEEVTGRQIRLDLQPARSFDATEVVLDVSRIQNELGWTRQFSLRDSIEDLITNRDST